MLYDADTSLKSETQVQGGENMILLQPAHFISFPESNRTHIFLDAKIRVLYHKVVFSRTNLKFPPYVYEEGV